MTRYQHSSGKPPASRTWGRRLGWTALAVLVPVLVVGAAFAWDGYTLLKTADGLKQHASAAQQAVSSRDADALATEVVEVQRASATFAQHTSGPHWWLAQWVPWVQDQTVPLQQAGASVKAVADDALEPLTTVDLAALGAPPIENGRIDPYVLEPYREALGQAAGVLTAQTETLAAVNLTDTVDQVSEPFVSLQSDLATLSDLVHGAYVTAELLPRMLGAEGERTIIVMVQNNAEPRTTGGIPGAVLELKVSDGQPRLVGYAAASSMVDADRDTSILTEDELRIFTQRMVVYPQDFNFTPEYPRTAKLAAAVWQEVHGDAPDAVLSVDPVALQYMLAGMDPLEVQGVTITGDNLAQVMLKDSYLIFPEPDDQDAFFAQASQVLFARMLAGGTGAVEGVEQAIEEGRFLLWSAVDAEQELLESTLTAGDFIAQDNTLGIFFNDGSGSKIGYYIDHHAVVTNLFCANETFAGQHVQLTLSHSYTGNIDDLPWYVSGGDVYVPAGEFHTNVLLYPAKGMGVTKFLRDGEVAFLNPEMHHGRTLATARVELLPGSSTVLEFEIAANSPGKLTPGSSFTPTAKPDVDATGVSSRRVDC